MDKYEKLYQFILLRRGDANIQFGELRNLLLKLGFNERIKGDHHIYTRQGMDEIINIQPKGNKAKPYQVKQIRNLILRYGINLEEDDA
ncbi:MAG: type II toxin-antitoxin system HicA family toxin [bacterium]|nr:type II toxin-antitoxin system HicA family toxin [bacterium]